MKKLLVLITILTVACTPAREQARERTVIRSMEQIDQKPGKPYETPLKNQNASASARIAALAHNTAAKSRFRFLHAFKNREEQLVGRVEVANNPFIQFALSSDRVKRDDLETFIAQVEKAHENGEVSGVQWAAFVVAREVYQTTGSTWGLIKFQTKAINQKVAATFPGVLGGVNELENSLPYLLIRKFDGGLDPANSEIQRTLATSLPLLTSDIHNDMRESLGAAIRNHPLMRNLSSLERVSSFILFQRMFSQLLLLKGYNSAKFGYLKDGRSAIRALTDDRNSFDSGLKAGYFMDPKTGKSIALSAEDIATYDPAKRPLLLTSKPGGALANLDLELKVLIATALAFEGSSPAAHFVSGPKNYLFGDITSKANQAVVPAETHSLAFGLTVMQLKNISARRIAAINESGKDVKVAGGQPAGMVLFDQQGEQKLVNLEQVLKLIEFNLQLDSAVERVIQKSNQNHNELKAMNSFYESESIIGNLVMLRSSLKTMRLPLYLLTMNLVRSGHESLSWEPAVGFKNTAGKKITAERKQRVGGVLRELGSYMDQPLIIEVGDRLANGQEL